MFGEKLKQIVSQADLVFANRVEGQKFTGLVDENEVFKKLLETCPGVALTLSEKGALVGYANQVARIDGFPVKSVDATGAGDMFAGGFLYGVTHGMTVEASAKLACFLASKVVSQLGPRLSGDVRSVAMESGMLPG